MNVNSITRCEFELRLGNVQTSLTLRSPCIKLQVAIVAGFHLFPLRTEKLSPFTPMVLRKWESRSLPFLRESLQFLNAEVILFLLLLPARTAATYDPIKQYQVFHFIIPALTLIYLESEVADLFLICHRQMRSLRSLGGPPGPRSRSMHSLAPIRCTWGCNWGLSPIASKITHLQNKTRWDMCLTSFLGLGP